MTLPNQNALTFIIQTVFFATSVVFRLLSDLQQKRTQVILIFQIEKIIRYGILSCLT